jgi:hypothetical protein
MRAISAYGDRVNVRRGEAPIPVIQKCKGILNATGILAL